MIICNKYKFIFLKTRKTAGTSIEIALSRLCNDLDIVTEVNVEDEKIRKIEGGRQGKDIIDKKTQKRIFYNHTPAKDIKNMIFPKTWSDYYKITVERNPWDKAISRYWWDRKGKNDFPSISKYLQYLATNNPEMLTNWNIYTIDDNIVVDKIMRYENINNDFNEVVNILGLNGLSLPKIKSKGKWREDRRPYSDVLKKEDELLIERVCKKEILAFNYKF